MSPKHPLITVAITTYNHERFIKRCVQSVLEQDIDDMEVLVLDDASPDATPECIKPLLSDPRLTYIRNEVNLGAQQNNARARAAGTGKYLAWVHGDDFMLPGHLSDAVAALESHPGCALAYSPCYWVNEDDRVITLNRHPGHLDCSYAGGRNEFAELLVYDNYITPSAAVMRRECMEQAAGFSRDPELAGVDWHLFTGMAALFGDFAFIKRATTAYRIHPGQFSNPFYADERPLRVHIHLLEAALAADFSRRLDGWSGLLLRHLQHRLATYPEEICARYDNQVQRLTAQLNECAERARRRPLGDRPKVSIVVPTMNRPELLQDALSSLNAQTYEHWEAVVVNDAGDDVSEIVASLDPGGRIRCVSHDRNAGLAAARNTGIRLSRGEILCYLDDDDMFYPHHLETVVAALREAGRECVYTDTKFVREELDNGTRTAVGQDQRNADLDYSLERLHVTNHIPVNAWAHRRSLLGRTGLFDESMKALEDWDLLLRIARTTDIRRLGTVTTEVRERGEGRLGQQMRHEFPDLYRRVYARYDDLDSPAVAAGRKQMLTDNGKGSENEDAARPEASDYAAWCEQRRLTEADAQLMAERMMRDWRHCPRRAPDRRVAARTGGAPGRDHRRPKLPALSGLRA